VKGLTGHHLALVPVALCLAAFHATLAVLGFDVTRRLLRIVLPLSLLFTGVILGLYAASDDPHYAVSRVFDSPGEHFTWAGFAKYVTVMCGASLTLVTSVADFCRYTPTRRDMRLGYAASAIGAAIVTTFVGGHAARRPAPRTRSSPWST
jgi:purine-cytosine permease-like protein